MLEQENARGFYGPENKPSKKMIKAYDKLTYDKSFCQSMAYLIRNASPKLVGANNWHGFSSHAPTAIHHFVLHKVFRLMPESVRKQSTFTVYLSDNGHMLFEDTDGENVCYAYAKQSDFSGNWILETRTDYENSWFNIQVDMFLNKFNHYLWSYDND